jgi:hypothetical protein
MLLRAHHLSVNAAKLIQSTYFQPTSLSSVLISSSHLCLSILCGVFLSGSAATPVMSHARPILFSLRGLSTKCW